MKECHLLKKTPFSLFDAQDTPLNLWYLFPFGYSPFAFSCGFFPAGNSCPDIPQCWDGGCIWVCWEVLLLFWRWSRSCFHQMQFIWCIRDCLHHLPPHRQSCFPGQWLYPVWLYTCRRVHDRHLEIWVPVCCCSWELLSSVWLYFRNN